MKVPKINPDCIGSMINSIDAKIQTQIISEHKVDPKDIEIYLSILNNSCLITPFEKMCVIKFCITEGVNTDRLEYIVSKISWQINRNTLEITLKIIDPDFFK